MRWGPTSFFGIQLSPHHFLETLFFPLGDFEKNTFLGFSARDSGLVGEGWNPRITYKAPWWSYWQKGHRGNRILCLQTGFCWSVEFKSCWTWHSFQCCVFGGSCICHAGSSCAKCSAGLLYPVFPSYWASGVLQEPEGGRGFGGVASPPKAFSSQAGMSCAEWLL